MARLALAAFLAILVVTKVEASVLRENGHGLKCAARAEQCEETVDCCENLACRKSSRKEAGACVYEPLALIEAESENGSSRSLVRSGETADDSTCVERNHHCDEIEKKCCKDLMCRRDPDDGSRTCRRVPSSKEVEKGKQDLKPVTRGVKKNVVSLSLHSVDDDDDDDDDDDEDEDDDDNKEGDDDDDDDEKDDDDGDNGDGDKKNDKKLAKKHRKNSVSKEDHNKLLITNAESKDDDDADFSKIGKKHRQSKNSEEGIDEPVDETKKSENRYEKDRHKSLDEHQKNEDSEEDIPETFDGESEIDDEDESVLMRPWREAAKEDLFPPTPLNSFEKRKNKSDVYWIKINSTETSERFIYSCENNALVKYMDAEIITRKDIELDNDIKCLNCMIQDYKNLVEWNCPEGSLILVRKYLGKSKRTGKVISKRLVTTHVSYLWNQSNETRYGETKAQNITVTETFDLAIMAGGKVFTKGLIGIPLLANASITVQVLNTLATERLDAQPRPMSVLSQTVEMPPLSWINATWKLFEVKHTINYTVDLEIDDDQPEYSSQRFREFKKLAVENKNLVIFHNKESGISLDFNEDNIVLKNVPVTETLTLYTIDYKVGRSQPLNTPLPSSANVIDHH